MAYASELLADPSFMAIDAWLQAVHGEEREADIQALLRREVPPLISWIVRGGCAVQCEHCIFPFEGPKGHSNGIGKEVLLPMLAQLSGRGHLVHEGRQLLPSQIPVLAAVKQAGYGVSVINNGQYATPSMLALCDREGLKVDALDVSIDGPEAVHNLQRSSAKAWDWAMNGLKEGRRISDKLTSLFTLTTLNSEHVAETGKIAGDLVDEWHLTTMSVRPGIEHMLPSQSQLGAALNQLAGLRLGIPVYLRSYSPQGFIALCEVIGKETVRKALLEAEVIDNGIVLKVEGITLYFYPKSLQCNETLVVALIRSIGKTYENAPPELQRLYLGLFWEGFEAENRLITKATKSPIVEAVEAVGAISYRDLQSTPAGPETEVGTEVILSTFRGGYRESNPN